ncbi:hypothetical protein [Aureispira anguillae]|uniref:T9SS C-terminal target domain-containing protein n=1 Tax=Aureispira anguillae TaxID=2864201 RepID=A0A915YM25_9BACT|nr:hypothetical protein [Aureispira anguillae]BDS15436.1 hypothetical protein AsAng_0062200 [Aureispira anguillae]
MNKQLFFIILVTYLLAGAWDLEARDYVDKNNPQRAKKNAGYRMSCTQSISEEDLDINNVRARLRAGGDMWWDGNETARYIVPNVDPGSGEPEVSALFAGGIWLGAYDGGGNLILAAQTYRNKGNDYWSGPLDTASGTINKSDCARWDEHFTVYGKEIDALRMDYLDPLSPGVDNEPSKGLLGWPAKGNPNFLKIHGFDIRDYDQDLAPFIDINKDGKYNPWDGDHPIIEVTGCAKDDYNNPVYADQMTWWVYNDNGNLHTQTNGSPMKMEVQALAFGYSTTDAVNNMTFYRYKLLNRNSLPLHKTYFSLWTDPDLGCSDDDYIGCDTVTGMGYVYNEDAEDDNPCGSGAASYGTDIPALGVDYFKGPLDSAGNEIGLSGFQYYINSSDNAIGNPETAIQHYRLMSGYWLNDVPVTIGGNGYNNLDPNAVPTRFVFPSFPNESGGNTWSMCTEGVVGADNRFLHTSGPFVLQPGATNEMISGVVWVPSVVYPCPSLSRLVEADELAQNLFDDCFKITNGPDAPNMDIIEMDKELVLNLNYLSGHENLAYSETSSKLRSHASAGLDTTYDFQGYKVYQVKGPNVSVTELDNENKARLIYQCDVEDDISTIINWEEFKNEQTNIEAHTPVIKVEGENKGIKHTFRILEDEFAQGGKDLINHKPYYFCVVAYAHNEYKKFDVTTQKGQVEAYLQGRRNFRIYTGIPRMNAPEYSGVSLQAEYGDQPQITRLDGQGVGTNEFLRIANLEEIESKVLAGEHVEQIVYNEGNAPVKVKVVDPLRVPKGTFNIHVCDQKYNWLYDSNTKSYIPQPANAVHLSDSIYWVISDLNDPTTVWSSYQTMDWNYEQYIPELGISVSLEQKDKPSHNGAVGLIGTEIIYEDSITYGKWYEGLMDGEGIFNLLKTGGNEDDHIFDPEQKYSEAIGGWYPFMLCDAEYRPNEPYLSLGNIYSHGARFRNDTTKADGFTLELFNKVQGKVRDTLLSALNNVNIVMTDNREDWSRCIVVETANYYHGGGFLGSVSPNWKVPSKRRQMEWKGSVSNFGSYPVYPSRNKDMSIDHNSVGMSWFPGYAYDVETGQRLNIFFGENSLYNGSVLEETVNPGCNTGDDMIFNPTNVKQTGGISFDEKVQFLQNVQGGQHIIYVTDLPYDSCKSVLAEFDKVPATSFFSKDNVIYQSMHITWASMAVPTIMKGDYGEEPPTKATIKLRVQRPFSIETGTFQNLGYPLYQFSLDGFAPTKEEHKTAVSALDLMRVVPNPYYAYSDYEITEADNVVKITNIPAKCNIRIYSLDGRFVREFKVAQGYNNPSKNGIARIGQGYEGPTADNQIMTSVDWDLKNYAAVPVAAGVYLVHIKVDGVGTKVLKSFIINRALDAQRL